MTNHVEELVKNHEDQLAAKDEELRHLNEAMTQLKEELEAAVRARGSASAEKRDHASAMLTPKGPAAKRPSSGEQGEGFIDLDLDFIRPRRTSEVP